MEESLQKSEANYRQLFKNSPSAIYQIDFRTGKFTKANDVFCGYLGYSQEEVASLSPNDILTDESKHLFSERLNKMISGEKVTESPEYEIVAKNGKRRWMQLISKKIYDSEGLAGADVVAHDITQRKRDQETLWQAYNELEERIADRTKELTRANQELLTEIFDRERAEEALQESETRYRSLFETSQDSIFIVDQKTGSFIAANNAACRLYGYSKDEFLRMKITDVSAEPEKTEAAVRDSITSISLRFHRKKDGTVFPVEIVGGYFKLGDRPFHTAFIHDISERMQAEEELKLHRDHLEDLVRESTRELQITNVRLNQEIEEHKQVQTALKSREKELVIKSHMLEEVNSALRVLMRKREEDKNEIEEKVLTNVKELVMPFVENLKKCQMSDKDKAYVHIIEANLNEIVSPFARKLTSRYVNLTPRELHVANLVKEGKSTKDVAELLNVSKADIDFHRKHIRKKLGMNRQTNLRTYLASMK
jgi:PAS domain S-box-containing protein